MRVTDFMVNLAKELKEKKGVSESTADAYIRTLVLLNNKEGFKNLQFLKDTESVIAKTAAHALSTRKNTIATVASVLSLYTQPALKKLYKTYSELLKKYQAELEEARGDTMVKTEKESENWVEWEDVLKKRDELHKEVAAFAEAKNITAAQYDKLLAYVLLCLYTYMPPRRNLDYQEMYVVREWKPSMAADRNYLDLHEQRFIFNRYKTAKASGQQIQEIPDTEEAPMKDALVWFLRHNPHYRASKNKATEFRFLVRSDGTPLSSVNAITRILNKLFGKRVGSSMLRHSYLSQKYGKVMEEMKEDAAAMAHDTATQKTYIRGGGLEPPALDVIEIV